MRSNLKKWILLVVIFLIVAVGALVAISLLNNFSTTTIMDIRFIDVASETEVFDRDVYLTAIEDNYFDVNLEVSASSLTDYKVYSTDNSVASVSYVEGNYRITYHKTGTATIIGTTAEESSVRDSFVLTVKDNVPTSFAFVTDEGNKFVESESEIYIYADDRDYKFDFIAQKGSIADGINLSSIVVLDNYNREVFEEIYVDDLNSQLVIKAKQSDLDTREYVTLQSKFTDEKGNLLTVSTFVVCVNVRGNYISDMQLKLSEKPNFEDSTNIYGEGLLNEGESRIGKVVLTGEVDTVYAKVRVVYTNGEMFDITQDVIAEKINGESEQSKPVIGNYYAISIPEGADFATIKFAYQDREVSLTFYRYYEGDINYQSFMDDELYTKVVVDGVEIYKFVYWDTRYKRLDAITDNKGNIIGFTGGNPACGA